MANNRVGAVDEKKNPELAAKQAASVGATIGSDGWWRDAKGNKLSHAQADDLVQKAGTAVGGNQNWGLGKGTLGDITGGRIGDVHIPPAVADALRLAAEAGGSIIGIPPQLTGALVNNLGHGSATFGDILKRGVGGALQGATVGGGLQGAINSGSGLWNTAKGAAGGAVKGLTHPFGNYTSALGGAAPASAGAAGSKLVPDGKGGFVNAFGQPRNGVGSDLTPDGKGGFVNAFGQPREYPGGGPPDLLNTAPGIQDSAVLGGAPGVQGLDNATMPDPGDPTAGLWGGDYGPPLPGGMQDANGLATGAAAGGGTPSWLSSLMGGLGKAAGGVGGFLTGNGGLNALGLAQGANAAMLGKKSSDFADKAGNVAMGRWNDQAPLRTAGIAGMLHPDTPDLSGLTGIRQGGNPFAKPTPSLTPPPGPTIPPTGLA